ncbi:hypothetical protein EBT16_01445 [bacterium]|nr:hypothetical protein [bacterium]
MPGLGYFGGSDNPRFFNRLENPATKHITFHPSKTWYTGENRKRNSDLVESIKLMAAEDQIPYFMSNGLSEISLRSVKVQSNASHVAEISYNSLDCIV